MVRNRVKRRLRHLVADRLTDLPDGARVVVRALPPAVDSSSALLSSDLDHAMAGALRRAAPPDPTGGETVTRQRVIGFVLRIPSLLLMGLVRVYQLARLADVRQLVPLLPLVLGVRARGAAGARRGAGHLADGAAAAAMPPLEPGRRRRSSYQGEPTP